MNERYRGPLDWLSRWNYQRIQKQKRRGLRDQSLSPALTPASQSLPAAGAVQAVSSPLDTRPLPTKRSCLQRLQQAGLVIDTVVDVGVLTGTHELIDAFPNARHLLFEPLASMNPVIEAAYSGVAHELHNVACFSDDGESFLVATSIDGSGNATHSRIAAVAASPGSDGVVSCEPIRRVRLDSLELDLGEHVLLKVDVDGVDLEVLKGATELLDRTDVVIVEAPIANLLERSNFLAERGFRLYDVVDLCYYHSVLSQVDVVFVKSGLFGRHAELEPWLTKSFSWDAYQQLTNQLHAQLPV